MTTFQGKILKASHDEVYRPFGQSTLRILPFGHSKDFQWQHSLNRSDNN
jgi:hypothetical protein